MSMALENKKIVMNHNFRLGSGQIYKWLLERLVSASAYHRPTSAFLDPSTYQNVNVVES